jgi:TatD DNase family protein
MLLDTHAHLDYPDFSGDLEDVIARAAGHGVTRIVTIGTGIESSRRAVALAEKHPAVFACVGVHPSHAMEGGPGFVDALRELASHPRVVGIGEAGLDYHRLPGTDPGASPAMQALGAGTPEAMSAGIAVGAAKAAQADVFRAQLDLACELGLNIVVHQRDAWADTLDLIRPYSGRLRGVFHCFGGDRSQAEELLAMSHLVSFTGIVTFKNAALVRETAASLPADAFMVETDCPYLAPDPHRGTRCEPWHTALVAEKIAALRGVSTAQIAADTTATAEKFFRFP